MLDALPLASGETGDGRASVRVSGATAKSVLRAIEAHGRTTGQCWASATTIGAEINRSERTVRRAIGYLESIEMLIVDRSAGKSPRCRINWGELSLRAASRENRDARKQPLAARNSPLATPPNPGQFDTDPGHSDRNPGQCVRRSVSKRKRSLPPPVPKSTDGPRRCDDVAEPQASWQEVEAVLCGLLGDWTRALRDAQRNGVGPRHVLDLVAHFHQLGDRVGSGALYWRLRRAHPSLAPQDGWPVETPQPRPTPTVTPNDVFMRVVRSRRRAGFSDDQIRPELERALVAAGFASDAEII